MADDYDDDDERPPRPRRNRRNPHARNNDPTTSHGAAESLTPEMMNKQFWILLNTIRKYGPGTMHDIFEKCELDLESVHKRLSDMGENGMKWLYRPGDTKKGPSGRKCKIWYEDLRPRNPDGTLVDEPVPPGTSGSAAAADDIEW